jgi:type II secretory pathway component GspD/PulD (secretin)
MNSSPTPIRAATAIVAVLLAVTLAPGVAYAGVNLDERIDINLSQADLAAFFHAFAKLTGAQIVLVPGLDATQKISIRLDNVSARTVLGAACESIGCRWHVRDEMLVIEPLAAGARNRGAEPLDEPIDIKLSGANVREVLSAVAQMLGADLSLDESLAVRAISLELTGRGIREALDSACARLGCHWQLVAGEGRPLLRVQAGLPGA